jgi:hypothetical protein
MPHLLIMAFVLRNKLDGTFFTIYFRNELLYIPKLYTCASESYLSMTCKHTNYNIIDIFNRKINC